VNLLRRKIEQKLAGAAPFLSRATWSFASTIRSLVTIRETRSSSAKPGIFTHRATHTLFSADCWPGSLTRCGAHWESPEHIDLVELGPGRGLFAQDVLGWSGKKFPEFFCALRYVLVESSSRSA